jgi:HEPN domain-containing protein
MNEELNDLLGYRIARARETLEEARVLADSGHWNACVKAGR